MSRLIPRRNHRCHVCGTVFDLLPQPESHGGQTMVKLGPTECPGCTAKVKGPRNSVTSTSQEMILTHHGYYQRRKPSRTIQTVLEADCRAPEDVDELMAAVGRIDLAAMEEEYREYRERERGSGIEEEAEDMLRAVLAARAAADRGEMLASMRPGAEAAKEALREERERCLRIFAGRRRGSGGGGTMP